MTELDDKQAKGPSSNREGTLMRILVTRALAYEYMVRDVFPDAWRPGLADVDRRTAEEMLSDAVHYADPSSTDMEASTRRVYAAHARRLKIATR